MEGNTEEPTFLNPKNLQGKPKRRKDVDREGAIPTLERLPDVPVPLISTPPCLLQSCKTSLTSAEPFEEGFKIHSMCFTSSFAFPSQPQWNTSRPIWLQRCPPARNPSDPFTNDVHPGQYSGFDSCFLESSSSWLPCKPCHVINPWGAAGSQSLLYLAGGTGAEITPGLPFFQGKKQLEKNTFPQQVECLNSLTCGGPQAPPTAVAVVTLITELWGF